MTSTYNLFDDMPYESYDNPFSEPRTVPMGWGPDVLNDHRLPPGEPVESQAYLSPDHDTGDHEQFQAEKFPKPRTTPKHWDVSALK